MSRGIYIRLALSNIKNNKKTYVPFMLTSALTVMMYLIMDMLTKNSGIDSGNITTILAMALGVMMVFSVIFLFYTNSFLIKRRKKEIAVYNILGMGKGHIGRMLTVETLVIAAASCGGGMAGGLVFGKLMHLILLRILNFDTGVEFGISLMSFARTGGVFLVIFMLTWLYNLFQVRLSSPAQLLSSSRAGEREPGTNWVLAVLGLVSLGGGYWLAVMTESPLEAIQTFFVAVVLVILGTYALFTAGSVAALKLLKKNKKFYYKANHFTAVSGMIYRMKQNAAGLATICILSTIVLVMVSSTASLYVGMEDALNNYFPYDYEIISMSGKQEDMEKIRKIVEEETKKQEADVCNSIQYRYSATAANRTGNQFTDERSGAYTTPEVMELYLIPGEDYRALERKDIHLEKGEALVYTTRGTYGQDSVTVNGKDFRVVRELETLSIDPKDESRTVDALYLIVADEEEIAEAGVAGGKLNYRMAFDIEGTESGKKETGESLEERLEKEVDEAYTVSRDEKRDDYYNMYGTLFFIGIYLGGMFLVATVLIIYYKQISEGFDDRERYQIMQKVGMGSREIKKSIRSQILLVFFVPLAAAILHIAVAFKVITKLLALLGMVNVPLFLTATVATVLAFAVLYVIVFAVTAREYYKIVH